MILNDEQLAVMWNKTSDGSYVITPHGIVDLKDTISDLQRQLAERDAAQRQQSLRYAAEIYWWHRNWHRDTGIPCGGEMEVCKRAETCRTQEMPALDAYVQEKVDRERDRLRKIENEKWEFWLNNPMTCGHAQRYRTGIDGKSDAEWLALECDECVICEWDRAVMAESEWWDGRQSDMYGEQRLQRLAANRAKVKGI